MADPVPDVDGSPDGAVVSFKIDRETGGLTRLNRKACGGEVPCYLSVSKNGKFILVASYGSGSVSVLPIGENGSAGGRRLLREARCSAGGKGANAPSIILDPSNRHALVADLGVGRILVYRFDDETGQLTPGRPPWVSTAKSERPLKLLGHEPTGGDHPRGTRIDPTGNFLLVANQNSDNVLTFKINAESGRLARVGDEIKVLKPVWFTFIPR